MEEGAAANIVLGCSGTKTRRDKAPTEERGFIGFGLWTLGGENELAQSLNFQVGKQVFLFFIFIKVIMFTYQTWENSWVNLNRVIKELESYQPKVVHSIPYFESI